LFVDCDQGFPEQWHKPPSFLIRTSVKDGIQRGQALWRLRDDENLPLPAFREPRNGFFPITGALKTLRGSCTFLEAFMSRICSIPN